MSNKKGFFSRLFGGKENNTSEASSSDNIVASPLTGKIIPLSQVSDETFATGVLGDGIAIEPSEGKLYSPVDGTVENIFETKHALFLSTPEGAEVLIHIGKDTVELKGAHFTSHIESGTKVKCGQLLLEFDVEAIRTAGYETVTPVIISNSSEFKIEQTSQNEIQHGETLLKLTKIS